MSYKSTIVVTGGQIGLGYEAARVIAKERPDSQVIISSRSSGAEAAQAINDELRQSNVKYLRLDLGSLSDIRKFADEIIAIGLPISVLVFNAGIQLPKGVAYTTDGLETTFGVNHVGHALLFHLLQPYLSNNARIVLTSSGTHDPAQKSGLPDAKYVTAELLAHPDEATMKYAGRQRYATSKLCNVLWTYALDRQRTKAKSNVTVTAFDPGLMPGTGLARDASAVEKFLWHRVLPRIIPLLRLILSPNIHTPQESGRNLARLAVSSEVEGVSGKYFEAGKSIDSSKDSYDESKQEDLWNWTVEFVARDKAEVESFKSLTQGTKS
ncbi:hypothetical protein M409DRAFT_37243 [Zasmidium cellare ATCC 36951]|uniref:NAD(P)-binding protein n=1 Tax=Zasmidium cellare ATCC 36951 TaxID=1080233 RepID=A0A6A6C947_ZASCE|nr:uncharacterized protein M409DRAFT_37243 [Zasmidium cellare ATCC 36951]KAF2163561.1 hypothetical protein M409DRAFT_37243 [Zasmidium cellare ATCC 36951]